MTTLAVARTPDAGRGEPASPLEPSSIGRFVLSRTQTNGVYKLHLKCNGPSKTENTAAHSGAGAFLMNRGGRRIHSLGANRQPLAMPRDTRDTGMGVVDLHPETLPGIADCNGAGRVEFRNTETKARSRLAAVACEPMSPKGLGRPANNATDVKAERGFVDSLQPDSDTAANNFLVTDLPIDGEILLILEHPTQYANIKRLVLLVEKPEETEERPGRMKPSLPICCHPMFIDERRNCTKCGGLFLTWNADPITLCPRCANLKSRRSLTAGHQSKGAP